MEPKKPKKDYQSIFSSLPPTSQNYVRKLQERAPEILRIILNLHLKMRFELKESLRDFGLFYDFAQEIRDGNYSRFDRMVINHLSMDKGFDKQVQILVYKGRLLTDAVMEVFILAVANSPKGSSQSRAWFFMLDYCRWATRLKRDLGTSLDAIAERNKARWEGILSKEEDFLGLERKAVREITDSVRRFIVEICETDLEREITKRLLDFAMTWKEINVNEMTEDLIRDCHNEGKGHRAVRDVVIFVRRRLAAWFVVDDLAVRLPNGAVETRRNPKKAKGYQGWFLELADARTQEYAKEIVETRRKVREPRLTLKTEWQEMPDCLDAVERKLTSRGIRFARQDLGGLKTLHAWCSVSSNKEKKRPVTVFYGNGGFQDFSTGVTGSIHDFLTQFH